MMDRVYEPDAEDRERLREPRGDVVQDLPAVVRDRSFSRLVAVGDRVAADLAAADASVDVAVVDGRIQREPADVAIPDADRVFTVENPAGGITRDAWDTTRAAVAHGCPVRVEVDGEDDLLALPALAHLEPDALLAYGQRDEGAVLLRADAVMKRFVDDLVDHRAHDHVIVGGSWDRFHAGHRSILLAALAAGRRVDVGVTTDRFLHEKVGDGFGPFEDRREAVVAFLARMDASDRTRVLAIDDERGNAVEEGDALMVTPDTRPAAERINAAREGTGRDPLDLLDVALVPAADGEPIRSTRIRAGEIDRNGRLA